MSAPSRSELITLASHGMPFEDALADPELYSLTIVTTDLIPNGLQTPAYTAAILEEFVRYDLAKISDPDIEPAARLLRSNALLDDASLEKVFVMPLNALRLEVGSAAITLAGVKRVREVATLESGNVAVALYETRSRQTRFDPRTMFTYDYSITRSSSEEFGTSVWVADSSIRAPQSSATHAAYPQIARLLLEHEDTVNGPQVLVEIDNAIDYLQDRIRDDH